MITMEATTQDGSYNETEPFVNCEVNALLPDGINREIGHFNVFNLEVLMKAASQTPARMPYSRKAFYKISLVRGRNIAEYADKVIHVENNALLFATPKIPYHWIPQDMDQKGYFCLFTDEFMVQSKSGVILDELPIFRPGGVPLFQLTDDEAEVIAGLFRKMKDEMASSYLYKYDLIRNFVMELIHYGQKLQPASTYNTVHNASARVSSLFIELLERQFPVASPQQKISLRTAKDYADRLAIHSNHLNKVLKEATGKTTTEHIANRLVQEAKILLRQTDWNISEIAYSLGFEQLSHFSNFFKKQTSLSPVTIRSQAY